MRIIRINKGKAVYLPIRLLSVIILIGITLMLVKWLSEPWSVLAAIVISSLLPAIWFATKVIIINEENKTIFDGVWSMGKKLGKPMKYMAIEEIFIKKVKTKQTVYTLPDKQNMVSNHEFRAHLKLDNGNEHFLFSHPIEGRVEEKVTKIKQKLEIN